MPLTLFKKLQEKLTWANTEHGKMPVWSWSEQSCRIQMCTQKYYQFGALSVVGPFTIVMSCFMKKGFLHSARSKRIQVFLNKIPNHQAVTILWMNSSSPSVSHLFWPYSHLGYGANVGNVGNWGSWKTCKTDSIGLNWIGWKKKRNIVAAQNNWKAKDDFKCPYSLLTVSVEQRSC